MIGRIKYWLLRLLLDDICKKSDCSKCRLDYEIEVANYKDIACREGDVFHQAREAWGLWEG